MSSYDEVMHRWIVRVTGYAPETVEGPYEVHRSDGYQTDMTFWPGETLVQYRHVKIGRTGQRHVSVRTCAAPDDVGEFLRELLELK